MLSPDDVSPTGEGLVSVWALGDSMTDAGILHGDALIICEQPTADDGDIIVAHTDDERALTIKRLVKIDGEPYLKSENRNVDDETTPLNDGKVLEEVARLHRDLSADSFAEEKRASLQDSHGAEGGSRTRTASRPRDFESRASASSATSARSAIIIGWGCAVNQACCALSALALPSV